VPLDTTASDMTPGRRTSGGHLRSTKNARRCLYDRETGASASFITRAQQLGEHDGIAPISLDTVAGWPRNEAGSNHVTDVSSFDDLPIDAISFWQRARRSALHAPARRKISTCMAQTRRLPGWLLREVIEG
jgi:hypothetical protein